MNIIAPLISSKKINLIKYKMKMWIKKFIMNTIIQISKIRINKIKHIIIKELVTIKMQRLINKSILTNKM
jgi:hypothetical protein